MIEKSEQILVENLQLKKRMVKGELKRKFLKYLFVILDKVMKFMELDLEMRELSQSGSVSGIQIRMLLDGNQESELLQEGDRVGLLIDCYQIGYFGGISEVYFLLEQLFFEVQISENYYFIRQVEDDWLIQEFNQEFELVGNLLDFGCFGID